MRLRLNLLSRPGCHLCEDLELALAETFGDRVEVDVLDVDRYPEWQSLYGLRIPVLLTEDGQWLCEGVLDAEPVARRLSQSTQAA